MFFNLYSEKVFEEQLEQRITVNGYVINNIRYTDDTIIFANSMEELQQFLYDLKLNVKKTKVWLLVRALQFRENQP